MNSSLDPEEFRVCPYLLNCIVISLAHLGEGFSFVFITGIVVSEEHAAACQIAYDIIYIAGIISCGYLMSYGRRLVLLVADIAAIATCALLLWDHLFLYILVYTFTAFVNSWWFLGTFTYIKDMSITYEVAPVILFCQAMKYAGEVLGVVLKGYELDNIEMRICIAAGLLFPSIVQVIAFFTWLRSEPIKYCMEKKDAKKPSSAYIFEGENYENIDKTIRKLRRILVNRKFVGIKYTTVFTKRYLRAFFVCLVLLALKAETYVVALKHRLPVPEGDKNFYRTVSTVANMGAVLLSMAFINRFQHRSLVIANCVLQFLIHSAISVLVYGEILSGDDYRFSAVILILAAEGTFHLVLACIGYVYAVELLPDKGISVELILFSLVLSCFLILNTTYEPTDLHMWYYPLTVGVSLCGVFFGIFALKRTSEVNAEATEEAYICLLYTSDAADE
eukprot:TRINITY_DN10762_c0_g2_i3.p1 TRINITY_DN10762_c0_g2~~TRINITY_DN10762_c0_g2_i3.p1  ORF type:complete len:478 (-),score=75.57 TRINITY_DN10762_c0_g2_i3:55-1398(-)